MASYSLTIIAIEGDEASISAFRTEIEAGRSEKLAFDLSKIDDPAMHGHQVGGEQLENAPTRLVYRISQKYDLSPYGYLDILSNRHPTLRFVVYFQQEHNWPDYSLGEWANGSGEIHYVTVATSVEAKIADRTMNVLRIVPRATTPSYLEDVVSPGHRKWGASVLTHYPFIPGWTHPMVDKFRAYFKLPTSPDNADGMLIEISQDDVILYHGLALNGTFDRTESIPHKNFRYPDRPQLPAEVLEGIRRNQAHQRKTSLKWKRQCARMGRLKSDPTASVEIPF